MHLFREFGTRALRSQVKSRTIGKWSGKPAQAGFSLIELLIVLAITLVLTALSLPMIITAVHQAHLRKIAANYEGELQNARLRAVQDNRFYTVRTGAAGGGATLIYVDIYPQNADGTSGGGTYVTNDPAVEIPSDVVINTGAPIQSSLATKMGFTPTVVDNVTTFAAFNARGRPCTPSGSTCSDTGGVGYVIFLYSMITNSWEAISVSPGGRIRTWTYESGGGGLWYAL